MGHPSSQADCFRLDLGWGIRLRTTAKARRLDQIELPEALAAAVGVAPQQAIEVDPASGRGPRLTLWRGKRSATCKGPLASLIPASATAKSRLFIAFCPPLYSAVFVPVVGGEDPLQLVACLVGLPGEPSPGTDFWHRVSRRIGVSALEPQGLAQVARQRGDSELADAIEASRRVMRPTGPWAEAWDLIAPLHHDGRFMAVTGGQTIRVAVGVADPRDRLPEQFVVTTGGLVWVEVDDVGDAKRKASILADDVLAPAQSERWVALMRAEHAVRRAAIGGAAWHIEPHGIGWQSRTGHVASDLLQVLSSVANEVGRVNGGHHSRHVVARSALAIERAARAARDAGLRALAADADVGFCSEWESGAVSASTLLGALRRE